MDVNLIKLNHILIYFKSNVPEFRVHNKQQKLSLSQYHVSACIVYTAGLCVH